MQNKRRIQEKKKKNSNTKLGTMAQACNPSYLGEKKNLHETPISTNS
jgi:hypothetical protein